MLESNNITLDLIVTRAVAHLLYRYAGKGHAFLVVLVLRVDWPVALGVDDRLGPGDLRLRDG